MKIITPIPVRKVITYKTKNELIIEIKKDCDQVKMELEQLLFQKKKLLVIAKKKGTKAVNEVEMKINIEQVRRKEKLENLDLQLSIMEKLEDGVEINDGNVQVELDVNIGDSWEDINNYALIVKDGVIIDIRKGKDY